MGSSGANPLAGKRVVVTRAREQAEPLCRELAACGAIPLQLPTVAFAPSADPAALDAALRTLAKFDWLLLTSQNAVHAIMDRCRALGLGSIGAPLSEGQVPVRCQIAAVGPATAEAAAKAGMRVARVANEHRSKALAEELGPFLRGESVLLPRSNLANADLPQALRAAGARVTDVVAYHTIHVQGRDESIVRALQTGNVDVITFFSPSAFHNLAEDIGLDILRALQPQTAFAAIGPVTASALRDAGLGPDVVSGDTSAASLIAALTDYFVVRNHASGRAQ